MKQTLIFFVALFSIGSVKSQDHLNFCLYADTFHIVVLGSSTAAGAGASTSDSSWVGRYRNYVQGINPGNQVTNLAVGGFTTWRLMPDGFIPPAGKPAPDTLHNITAAVELNPDGIIINLPSNDAATGVDLNTQMSNFIQIVSVADSFNIPVWVCTTQPRNGSATLVQVQMDVRDSINSYFGNMALDFWTGVADSTGQLLYSPYNSGDGVHLNNSGHKLLFERVRDKSILTSLQDTSLAADLSPVNISLISPSACGDSNAIIQIVIVNAGAQTVAAGTSYDLQFRSGTTGTISTAVRAIPDSIPGCQADTIQFTYNTLPQLDISFRAITRLTGDAYPQNDTSSWLRVISQARPVVQSSDIVICPGDTGVLFADGADTTLWYGSGNPDSIIATGDYLKLAGLTQTDTFYTRSAMGPFYYVDVLQAAPNKNINWNGVMFDLIAHQDTIILDSIEFTAGSTANMVMEARFKTGTYKGHENNSASWSLWGTDTVNAVQNLSYYADFGPKVIYPGDTLGIYLFMQNSTHNLSYQSVGSEQVFNASALSFSGGSGIAHTFGTVYNPRIFNGKFFYHHGTNLSGQCQSYPLQVIAQVSDVWVSIGNDLVITVNDTVPVSAVGQFSSFVWMDGNTNQQTRQIIGSSIPNMPTGYDLWIEVTDSLGCTARDSIKVFITGISSLPENQLTTKVFPNPASDFVTIESQSFIEQVMIVSVTGINILDHNGADPTKYLELSLKGISAGIYLINIKLVSGQILSGQLIIE